jgi:hypothetical protein
MRTFLSTHWKSILAIIILVLLALFVVPSGSASPSLATRLQQHTRSFAGHGASAPAARERAARHIATALAGDGYRVRRQQYRAAGTTVQDIEASLANVAAGARPARTFIVGVHYDPAQQANEDGGGAAVLLELARLLHSAHLSRGTEIRFVFFVHEARSRPGADGTRHAPGSASFIALAGTRASIALAAQALGAFRGSTLSDSGLAAPAYVQGVTLSDRRQPSPVLMVTDTSFARYPCRNAADDSAGKPDYDNLARAVDILAHTIAALAGTAAT